MSDKVERYFLNAPRIINARFNPIVKALFEAWAISDENIVEEIKNTKDQIFVRTASGQYLDRLASGLGVSRPASLGLLDSDFQELIPNLSLKAKQVRQIFYDTMDVFWGPLFSRANVTSLNFEPFNVIIGDKLQVTINHSITEEVEALPGDIAISGAATAEELAAIFSRLKNATPSVIEDQISGNKFINLRTNTPGSRGSIEVLSSSMVGGAKVDFPLEEVDILDLDQRTVVYEITHRELIIEIPAFVPTLRRILRGSHHFHQDETLEAPIPPNNGVWAGSFLFNPGGSAFSLTGQKTTISENLEAGSVYTKVTVASGNNIPDEKGFIMFDFGRSTQEFPVPYIARPNNNTILLDPSYVFQKTHLSGASINFIEDRQAYKPRTTGADLPIYFTSPVSARTIVQGLLETLAAAGVVVVFKILLPKYKYLVENPYAE
jgi:hypothetical protein